MSSILTVSIANNTYLIRDNSLSIGDAVDQPKTCSFQIEDPAGTGLFFKGQPVTVTDSVKGVLYTGFIDRPGAVNLYPNAYRQWQTNCLDQTLLAMQRTSNSIYNTQPAAVILCDQLQNILANEGVTGSYALDYNHLQSDWTVGNAHLSGVVAATNTGDGNVGDGDLELAPAGVTISYVDSFAAGTLTNTQVVNGALQLASTKAIQVRGTAVQGTANPYVYVQIWHGASPITSGDTLVYDVWVSSTSPQQEAGVDGYCTDGTSLRDFSPTLVDQNGIGVHPSNDLSGFATDAWYTRTFDLTPLAGKTLSTASVALEGNSSGAYTAYLRKIKQVSSGGVDKQTIFSSTSGLQMSQIIGVNAYINVALQVCTVYEMSGTRTAPAISLTPVGFPLASLIDWIAPAIASSLTPSVPSTNSTLPTVIIQTSIDTGATWQTCSNFSIIPNLLAGMSVSGRTLLLRQVFTMQGTDPTLTPTLGGLTLSIQPSYAATKTDVIQTEMTQANWNAGTLTTLVTHTDNSLTLNEVSQNWHTGPLSGQTLYGSNGPIQQLQAGQIYVACSAGATSDVRSRLDFAGQWKDFTAECDIAIGTAVANTTVGLVYRTTGWSNTQNTFAWKAWYTPGSINLGFGTDGGSDSYTSVASVSVTLSSGAQHRMKLVISGTSHQVYLDGVLYINVTDTHYNQSGYLALAFYNNASGVHGGLFDNFGVCKSLTGTFQSVTQSLSAAGTYGNSLISWQETFDSSLLTTLIVQTSIDGGSTYQVCTNGGAIPNLVYGQSLSGINLIIQMLFTSPNANLTPVVTGLTAWVLGQFNASGTRTTAPLGNDTMTRANVVGGFGTSFDGQTYTKNGTGTVALTSNEGLISATTGDVEMVLGTINAADEDGSVRFAVSTISMQAGIELRRIDANNFIRLSTTTSTLTLSQCVAGTLNVLTTVAVALSINTFYRMRLRVVGNIPTSIYGRVWVDGTFEPANAWTLTYGE